MPTITARRIAIALGLALMFGASALSAQSDALSQSELDTPTRLASTEVTARILSRSYPPNLKRQGVTGTVELQFVVDATGKVETSTVRVLESSSTELTDAARAVIGEVRFRPGVKSGQPVRSVVTLPISYR
jgi:periplasmic protein TonB